MADGTRLGLPFSDEDEDTSTDFLSDDYDEEAEDAPDAGDDTPTLTTIGDEEDEDEGPPPPQQPEEEPEEEEDEDEEQLYAGRYPSLDAFQQGYKEIQAGFTRVVQENRQLEAQLEQQRQEQETLKNTVLRMAMENDPELAERLQAEEAFSSAVQQAVDQRVAPIQEQVQAQQQQEQNRAFLIEAEQAIRGFWNDHEISQGDEVDVSMREAMETLVSAGVPLSPANREHLELVYEALGNRNLLFEIANARPEIFQVPGGTDFLRSRAGATIPPAGSPPQGTQPKPRGTARRRVEAHVETSSGAPAPQAAPEKDEFDEAVEWYNARSRKGPLFGSRR